MAPSQMEHQQEQTLGQGYTHKKFNCGYSHKKLGMRMRQRQQQQEEKENLEMSNLKQQVEENKISKPNHKGLFRPYALDEETTPRKRKISRSSESSEEGNSSITTTPANSPIGQYIPQQQLTTPVVTTPPQTCASPALSPNSYAMRLQRQRAALYMRYISQFQQSSSASVTQLPTPSLYHPMGYPNVTAPIFNGC